MEQIGLVIEKFISTIVLNKIEKKRLPTTKILKNFLKAWGESLLKKIIKMNRPIKSAVIIEEGIFSG